MSKQIENSSVLLAASNAAAGQVSVDSHFHIFKAAQSVAGARYTPSYASSFKDWQSLAAAAGVTHGVLVQTSFMGADNRLLLAQLALHPHTLRGVAVVAPDTTMDALSALHAQGVRGIRLNLAGRSHDMAGWANASGLWDALFELGWHVELHTDAGYLADVLAALPLAIPLVVDHFAKPTEVSSRDGTVVALRQRSHLGGKNDKKTGRSSGTGSVHIKLSAPYRLKPVKQAEQAKALTQLWLAELGPETLLWGSDWPCTNHEAQADYPELHNSLENWLVNDDRLIALVRSENPLRLYWS